MRTSLTERMPTWKRDGNMILNKSLRVSPSFVSLPFGQIVFSLTICASKKSQIWRPIHAMHVSKDEWFTSEIFWQKIVSSFFNFKRRTGGGVLWLMSPPVTEEIGAMGREIEPRQGIWWKLKIILLKDFKKAILKLCVCTQSLGS
jgi:hypothetical protein